MRRIPKVGDRVVAVAPLNDWTTGIAIPTGTTGEVVGVGLDKQFGYAQVAFDVEGTVRGLPIKVGDSIDAAARFAE